MYYRFCEWCSELKANEFDIFLTFSNLYLETVNFLQGPLKGFNQKVKRLLKFQRRRKFVLLKQERLIAMVVSGDLVTIQGRDINWIVVTISPPTSPPHWHQHPISPVSTLLSQQNSRPENNNQPTARERPETNMGGMCLQCVCTEYIVCGKK